LFDSIIANVQGAESTCRYCGQTILCDIVEGGGVPDWKTRDGDYGCSYHPLTVNDTEKDEGCYGHMPLGVEIPQTKNSEQ
jgi:hypothetical protein